MTGAVPKWTEYSDKQLLKLRLCDLGVGVQGDKLERAIQCLYGELADRNVLFRPHMWISDDWYVPDDVPGIALPFYLTHPRLEKLELTQMLEVEGGTHEWCMKILRHETGHAIENAYRLTRKKKRIQLFGKTSQPYPDCYSPKPYSKRYVLHLDNWYAQSHPDEDFAETFAVWLNPHVNWCERYRGWPVLRKLQYMDELMTSLAGMTPPNHSRKTVDPIGTITKTLDVHYKEKRERYGLAYPSFYDRDLLRLFSNAAEYRRQVTAARFMQKVRKEVRRKVAYWTGLYQYTINNVIDDMIERARELNLRLTMSSEQTELEFTTMLTVQTMNYLHSGYHRVIL